MGRCGKAAGSHREHVLSGNEGMETFDFWARWENMER